MARFFVILVLLLAAHHASAEQVTFVDEEGRWPSGGLSRQGPSDLTSPIDYTAGPIFIRYEVRDKPTDIRTVAQVCIWQDGSSRETCDTLVEYNDPGVYYAKIRPLSAWWVKNPDKPPDFSRGFQNFRFVHKGNSAGGGWLDTCGGGHCMGASAAPHIPISYRIEMILTSEGHTFVPPDHWQECPVAVCGAYGDKSAGAAGGRVLIFEGGASAEHASANARGQWEVRDVAVERDFLVDATDDETRFTTGQMAAYGALVLFNTQGGTFSRDTQQIIEQWYRDGGSIVLVHGAAEAGSDWPFLGSLIGGAASHRGSGALTVAPGHAVSEGLSGSLNLGPSYVFSNVPGDAEVFLTSGGMPAGFAREVQGGRVIYLPVGHDKNVVEGEAFHTLIGNAIQWALVGGEGGGVQPAPPQPQPQPNIGPCHLITSANPQAVTEGFSMPFDVFSRRKELLLSVICTAEAVRFIVGFGSERHYIFHHLYVWRGDSWEQQMLSGLKKLGGAWYLGLAQASLPIRESRSTGTSYVVAYVCSWLSAQERWACGCRDQACAEGLWQLQAFRR